MPKTRDVSNRRLPLERLTAPAPRAFPAHSRDFHRADTPRSLWSPHSMTGGTNVSRRPNRFGGSHRTRFPLRGASRAEAVTDLARRRGRFLPTVPDATEPLTSLSPLLLTLGLHAPSCVHPLSRNRPRPFGFTCGSLRVKEPPRPLSAPLRKETTLPSIRDAFHRQGPFVGSGGSLPRARWPSLPLRHPGPATVTPLLATWRPPNDALAPPWALHRTAPFHR